MSKVAAPKKPVRGRPRKVADEIGVIRIPERFAAVVGDLVGIPLLKALYYLNEGERIGREGAGFGEQMRQVHLGVLALLERAAAEPADQQLPPNLIPFRPPAKRPDRPSGGAAAPPGLTVADAQAVRDYCNAAAGGDERLSNAGYARVMEDATNAKTLNSRWQTMAEDAIEKARTKRGPGSLTEEELSLFGGSTEDSPPDEGAEWDEGN